MAKRVLLVMGSISDKEIVAQSVDILKEFGVDYTVRIASAHRTPEETHDLAANAKSEGYGVIVAFAGAAAHLAGVIASKTNLPIIAVPISCTPLNGLDSLLSSVMMPGGIPVATMALGKAGAKNAALYALQILALSNEALYEKLEAYRKSMAEKIAFDNESLSM